MKLLPWIAALTAGVVGFLTYIGYWGGAVFTPIPATGPPGTAKAGLAAVILSGDMGFAVGMGPKIADKLAADGIPVIGVNSLTFFRHARMPGEVKAMLADATQRALAFGHARQVILIGQSFGADMLHVGLTGLPPRLRERIRMVALVVPTETVFFQASPSEMFSWVDPDADARETAGQLTWVPTVCIRGREEQDSLCPHLHQRNVQQVVLPGGHPLHWDVDAVHAVLSAAIDRTASP